MMNHKLWLSPPNQQRQPHIPAQGPRTLPHLNPQSCIKNSGLLPTRGKACLYSPTSGNWFLNVGLLQHCLLHSRMIGIWRILSPVPKIMCPAIHILARQDIGFFGSDTKFLRSQMYDHCNVNWGLNMLLCPTFCLVFKLTQLTTPKPFMVI